MSAERDDVINDVSGAPTARPPGRGAGMLAFESINGGMAAVNSGVDRP